MLVDTHAHLNFPDFQKDLDQIIKRAKKNNVTKIICASSNLADAKEAIKLAKKYQQTIFAAVGIHPQQTDTQNKQTLKEQVNQLTKLAQEKEVVAIGECGLDFSPAPPGEENRSRSDQDFLFQEQIKIAQENKLPLLIHSRRAFAETLSTLKKYKNIKGVFHCYSAGRKGIDQVNQLGFYFGVDGNLTYDQGLQNIFSQIPLEKILLETDCPFLAPEPYRGQRSEPAHVKNIAECLAKLKKVKIEKVTQITNQNVKKLFSI